MSKIPNHLATLIDHQSAAKSALPSNLAATLKRLMLATAEVKTILVDCLPEEILASCQVVAVTEEELTLSVLSQTAANHMRYLQSDYVRLLSENSTTFARLRKMRIIVTATPTHHLTQKNNQVTLENYSGDSLQPYRNKGFSETTRQTIAHVASHVIKDERLKKALLKLAKED